MKTFVCMMALSGFAFDVCASDEPVMMVHPPGLPALTTGWVSPPNPTGPEDVLCGDLNYDGVNGLAAQRWDSIGLESWVMAHCEPEDQIEIQGFNWLALEHDDEYWLGVADFAIWDAATIENGCADDSNAIASGRNILNTREDPIYCSFGCIWMYHASLVDRPVLEPGQYYFAVRNVAEGQSFIMTVPCNGRKPVYFHSDFFGYPCAVPSDVVFGVDYCAAIEVLGAPPFPCENDGCGTFKKLACKGSPMFNVVARGTGTPGAEITVNLDGEDACVTVNPRGKWKLVTRDAPGSHTARACGLTKTCIH